MNKSLYYTPTPFASRGDHLLLVLGLEYSTGKKNKDLRLISHAVPFLLYVCGYCGIVVNY